MNRQKLSGDEAAVKLHELEGWTLSEDGLAIARVFRFSGFASAFGFMAECAIFAEKIDHHPEWKNVFRTVEVRLTTHSARGLSALDFELAAFMDKAAAHH